MTSRRLISSLLLALLVAASPGLAEPVRRGKVADLKPCNADRLNILFGVKDGANANDCSTGGGSAKHLCWCDGSSWAVFAPAAPTGAAGGDLAGSYPNPTVGADKVALGTDTTGGYAASATEAGAASSCLAVATVGALNAIPGTCTANALYLANDSGNEKICSCVTTDTWMCATLSALPE